MIKPKRLKNRDKTAIVSLSWGGMGDECFIHKSLILSSGLSETLQRKAFAKL